MKYDKNPNILKKPRHKEKNFEKNKYYAAERAPLKARILRIGSSAKSNERTSSEKRRPRDSPGRKELGQILPGGMEEFTS